MLAKLALAAKAARRKASRPAYRLFVGLAGGLAEAVDVAADTPDAALLRAVLRRRGKTPAALLKAPVSATLADGSLVAWVVWNPRASRFERHTLLRKAVMALLADGAQELEVELAAGLGSEAANDVLYVCWINGATLPTAKAEPERPPLAAIAWRGAVPDWQAVRPLAEGNLLARRLTAMAPNVLTPRALRKEAAGVARATGSTLRTYDLAALRKLGCGAFLSVAAGSDDGDAAIVHLAYAPRGARGRVALVGKGICFDTGGYNLKPARAMSGMHEDMSGAAVVLGILHAAAAMRLPLAIDAWLAIARNQISPSASVPGDVVRAVNGKTIEIVHTDAEGRMVLADTLALAARAKPDLVVDFATLTGSMVVALGTRQSGVLSPDVHWAARAVDAGARAGERLVAFAVPEDYAADLDSEVADLKQCTLEGEADHLLAASFLKNFVGEHAWLHVDLAAVRCKGGLGAAGSDVTGFGVASGLEILGDLASTL